MNGNSKRPSLLRSSIQIKEIHLKNNNPIYHLFSPKKQYINQLSKTDTVNNLSSSHYKTKRQNDKPHNGDYSNYHTTTPHGCFNVKQCLASTNFGKKDNGKHTEHKQIIHYSTNININVHKERTNAMSLYTIHEQKMNTTNPNTNTKTNMNMSNGFSAKNINNSVSRYSTSHKKPKDKERDQSLNNKKRATIGPPSLSSSSKLFQLRKLAYPLTYNNSYSHNHYQSHKASGNGTTNTNTTAYNTEYKSPNKRKKRYRYYQNQYNTNPTTINSNSTSNYDSNNTITSANLRKRNKNYIKNQTSITPKRTHSLNKALDNQLNNVKPNLSSKPSNTTIKRANHYHPFFNKVISGKSKSKDKDKDNTKLKGKTISKDNKRLIKKNTFIKAITRSNKLSKSLKKEPSYFSNQTTSNCNSNNNANSNITTYNNKKDYSKDMQMTQTSQNSFLLTKNNYNSLDNSTDVIRAKMRSEIKVNCKQQSANGTTPNINANASYIKGRSIIKKYSKYLSQYEIEELSQFVFPIYYTTPFESRAKKDIQYANEMNSSFSYVHFPNYLKGGITLPKSKSYKHFYDVYSEVENYNDDEGNYILVPGDHIMYRYEIIEVLGKGSFGEAVKCLDHKTKEVVCVKIIKANSKFGLQAMIETKILQHIKKTDYDNNSNVVKFYSQFIFRNHICLVFELLDINLYDYLKLNDYIGFDMKKIKGYAIELLFTLLFLKRQRIIHCDLKPENILLLKDKKSHVKVIDFGSSCFENERLYTYIQSRFYRAPEVILEQGYGVSIDMWSLGCILPELFTGVPIFPGENERDQLMYIFEYLGLPSIEYIGKSNKRSLFFDERNQPIAQYNPDGSLRQPKSKTIADFLKGTSDLFQDFIKKCLQWNPKDRLTPESALMHNWIIKDMTTEQLYMHKEKISSIKIGHCQIHKLNSLPSSLKPIRTVNKKISSKSNHSHQGANGIGNNNKKALYSHSPKTPNKSPTKRNASKDIPKNPSTTKYSLTKQKKFMLMYDTNNPNTEDKKNNNIERLSLK